MTLYEINETIAQIIENGFAVDEETGEITFDETDMESLKASISEKIENVACYIKNLTSDIAELKAEEKKLAERRKSKEAKMERLRSYLDFAMHSTETTSYESARCKVSYRKSAAVEVSNPELVPMDYQTIVEEVKINKTLIKNAIKEGKDVPGAELVERQNLQIK